MNRPGRYLWLPVLIVLLAGCAGTPDERFPRSMDRAAELNTRLGVGYMQQGEYSLAREKLDRALDQNARYAPAHTAMAELHVRLDNPDEADDHYRRSLRLDSDNPETHNNYGVFLCDQGRLREAERHFLRAARHGRYSTPEYAWTNAGICARLEPDAAKAEEYLRRALAVNPGFPGALLEMAELGFDNGDLMKSRAFIERYHSVVRPTARSLWLGVRIERQLGDEQQEQEYAQRLREHFPESREARQLEDL